MSAIVENMWFRLASLEINNFMNDVDAYCEMLVTGITQRVIFSMCYFVCVRAGVLVPIESVPVEEKNKIWATAKDKSKERLDQPRMLELAKCLYTIQELTVKDLWHKQ